MAGFDLGLVIACRRERKKVLSSAEEMQAMAQVVGWWEFLGSGLYCTKAASIREALLQHSILAWISLNNQLSYQQQYTQCRRTFQISPVSHIGCT